jgi:hypothetical protein
MVEHRPWAKDVAHWKPLPVMAVIATRTSAVSQLPCRATDRGSACSNFLCFCLVLGPSNAQTFSAWKHAPWLMGRTCIAGSGGSALYFFGDRRCANRQRDPVVYEGELMSENILPDLGIQETFTGNQGIHGAQEHSHIFPA